jgi:hypothetical protein
MSYYVSLVDLCWDAVVTLWVSSSSCSIVRAVVCTFLASLMRFLLGCASSLVEHRLHQQDDNLLAVLALVLLGLLVR